MAESIKTIKPGGGGDYTSLQTWEAALSANPTDDQVAECYEGNCSQDLGLEINVSNTSNVRIVIRAASGEAFHAQSEWATSMYATLDQGARLGSNHSWNSLIFSTPNIHVEDMIVRTNSSSHNIYGSEDITFQRCFIYACKMQANTSDAATGGTINLYNCVGRGGGTYFVWTRHADSVVNSINCTWCSATGDGVEGGYMRSDGTFLCKNTWVLNHKSGGLKNFNGTGYTGNYNGSDDTSAPGANVQHDVTATDWMVSMGSTTWDYHLKSAKFGSFVGTDESGTISTKDIDNQTRTAFDVGADADPSLKVTPTARTLIFKNHTFGQELKQTPTSITVITRNASFGQNESQTPSVVAVVLSNSAFGQSEGQTPTAAGLVARSLAPTPSFGFATTPIKFVARTVWSFYQVSSDSTLLHIVVPSANGGWRRTRRNERLYRLPIRKYERSGEYPNYAGEICQVLPEDHEFTSEEADHFYFVSVLDLSELAEIELPNFGDHYRRFYLENPATFDGQTVMAAELYADLIDRDTGVAPVSSIIEAWLAD